MKAGYNATTATNDVFVGAEAGASNLGAAFNTFIGRSSGQSNSTGEYNTFLGYYAGGTSTSGHYNVAVGSQAGQYGAGAGYNVSIGYLAGNGTTGQSNFFGGYNTGVLNTGSYNVLIGESAGRSSGAASFTTALGYYAGYSATGSNNVFLGKQAGTGETGSNKLYIENSDNTATPLIYGDFSSNQVSINTKPKTGYDLTTKGSIWAGSMAAEGDVQVGSHLMMNSGDAAIILPGASSYLRLYEIDGDSPIGFKAGGSLIADDNMYANPTSNDLIVKGHIGIGTPLVNNPNNYALAVNGAIGAQDLRIENNSTTWPDYVFSKGYSLPRISEVEKYVAENNHLEGVPSAEEVQKNGHSVADMDAILLKKVEELTLYIIQQQKQLEAQQKELDALKKQLKN